MILKHNEANRLTAKRFNGKVCLLYKTGNAGRGVKITNPKGNGLVLKIAAQKNTHSKLKNGQHADTTTNAALACFSFYKRFTLAKQHQRSGKQQTQRVGLVCVFVSALLRVAY
jgi:hypothetical protein